MDFESKSKITTLNEIKRLLLVARSTKDTPARFERRLTIAESEIHYYSVDIQEFLDTGTLVFRFQVRDYDVNIRLTGLVDYLRKKLKGKVNYDNIRKYLNYAMDHGDVFVSCTCPDFRYRFAYTATKKKFIEGKPETRPSNITNPHLKGGICKHIIKLLNNKSWIRKYTTLINLLLRMNPQLVEKKPRQSSKKK